MGSQPELKTLIKCSEIEAAVSRLAAEINRDYDHKELTVIGILCGSFIFMADLVRKLQMPLEIDFIGLSSYGDARESSGKIEVTKCPGCQLKGRHLLIVEDISDTGLTSTFIRDYLKSYSPASVRLCALLDKPARHRLPVKIDYLGLSVPDEFLVGYGLDCAGKYRNLPDIHIVEESCGNA